MKYVLRKRLEIAVMSRPVRALWIEITGENSRCKLPPVEAREGLVD